ncbi:hypothetical protein ACPW96_16680 [Micromonospora sp. DT81.3]|uniref:hypothetical protein n=1 Tax=Micromonospora sp. DT81.3 TaxID=3416523 RepID=UPI003CEBCF7B
MTGAAGSGRPGGPRAERSEEELERWRAYRRRYREAHPEQVAASSLKYREKNREKNSARERERHRRKREKQQREAQQRERRLSYSRRYAETHRELNRERQRAYLARRFEEDPVGFRQHRNALQREWYARHKEEIKAKARDAYRTDQRSASERARRYYERHADEIKQRRRAAYQQDPEKILAYNREWKARERRRKAAGLPPRRIHRVSPAERDRNAAAADAFFTRSRTPEQARSIRAEWITVRKVRERQKRDAARARATDLARNAEVTARRQEERRRQSAGLRRDILRELAEAGTTDEEARMDEIARAINARLRSRPQRRAHHNDPAAPHTQSNPPHTGGLSR